LKLWFVDQATSFEGSDVSRDNSCSGGVIAECTPLSEFILGEGYRGHLFKANPEIRNKNTFRLMLKFP